jgi:peptidoglycan/xylan/chitin deacetylase (PgdA/CDA1 family)
MGRKRYLLGWLFGIYKIVTLQLCLAIKKHNRSEELIAIYFHNPSVKKFNKLIRWVIKYKFTMVTQNDVLDFLFNKKKIRGGIWITFDDGWKNFIDLLPVIEKFHVPVTLFLTTSAISEAGIFWSSAYPMLYHKQVGLEFHQLDYREKINLINRIEQEYGNKMDRQALSPEEIKRLSHHPLIDFGCHTHHHVSTIHCEDEDLRTEILQNKENINQLTGRMITCFAYPYGEFSGKEDAVLEESGIRIAVTGLTGKIKADSNPYYLPRIGFSDGSFLENYCKIVGCWY